MLNENSSKNILLNKSILAYVLIHNNEMLMNVK